MSRRRWKPARGNCLCVRSRTLSYALVRSSALAGRPLFLSIGVNQVLGARAHAFGRLNRLGDGGGKNGAAEPLRRFGSIPATSETEGLTCLTERVDGNLRRNDMLVYRLSPRVRPNSHEILPSWTTPETDRPRALSIAGRQGTTVSSRDRSTKTYLPKTNSTGCR